MIFRTKQGPGKHEEYVKTKKPSILKVNIAFVHLQGIQFQIEEDLRSYSFLFTYMNSVLLLTISQSFMPAVRC